MAAIDIKKEAKNPYGAYLLFGEEDYLKRYYASEIRRAVVGDSPYAPFNHILFSRTTLPPAQQPTRSSRHQSLKKKS